MKHLDISIDENLYAHWNGNVIGHIEKGEDGEHYLALTAPIHIIEQMVQSFDKRANENEE